MQLQSSRRVKFMVVLGAILILSFVCQISINAALTASDRVYNGVKVGDIDVGGLSETEAQEKIADYFTEKVKQAAITLTFNEHEWKIYDQDIDLSIDSVALAHQAYQVGRTGNVFFQIKEKYMTLNRGYTIPWNVSYNEDKFQSILTRIAAEINCSPMNAKLVYRSKLTIIPEQIGLEVDNAAVTSEVETSIYRKVPVSVVLTVKEVVPEITRHALDGIDGIMASYTTQFDGSNQNRSTNIRLAAKNITGILIRKDEQFSFNDRVGLRSAKYGYKEAPVFIDGKLVPDWGGGVCQVSSTLYNAALLANMEIIERTSHFRPPGYVPLGQDATVADNQLDFKFKNSSENNIYITAEVGYGQITVYIYGKLQPNRPHIEIVGINKQVSEPNTIVMQDATLELGQKVVEVEGQNGFNITTYRVRSSDDGTIIDREYISTDQFPPEDRVIRIGTKALQPK
ncbi:MAG: VanW like protein [Firmicutes bacterium]|nr:VanW like protein [Bacillota bacterium]